jgi:hypothetical protein
VRREIDYALARRATIRDFQRGVISRLDLCDAHPELLRAARHLGDDSNDACPICAEEPLKRVLYVYGDVLKAANGRPLTGLDELERLRRRHDEFACYVVEVCVECSWNYLLRTYLVGRRHAG